MGSGCDGMLTLEEWRELKVRRRDDFWAQSCSGRILTVFQSALA